MIVAEVQTDLKKFGLKLALVFAPLVLILAPFFIFDPFKVLYSHKDFYRDYRIVLDRDYVSTELYLKRRDIEHFDSFIFGSSRSLAFWAQDWKAYLPPSARPFHFDASNESLFGILGKFRLIQSSGQPVKDVLIVLDSEVLSQTTDNPSHLFIKHPAVSGGSWLQFYMTFVRAYLSEFFYFKYWDMALFHRYRPYMEGIFNKRVMKYIPETNDLYPQGQEDLINQDPEKYYREQKNVFDHRYFLPEIYAKPQIRSRQLAMLREIEQAMRMQQVRYQIVISPVLNQIPLPAEDLTELQNIFGKDKVHDYSGVNRFTSDIHHYYDQSHYRAEAARQMMKEIYS